MAVSTMMLLDREKDSAVKTTLSGRYRGLGGDSKRKKLGLFGLMVDEGYSL